MLWNLLCTILLRSDNNIDDNDDGNTPPEVIEAGEVSPLPGCAQDPEDVLGAVQVDQQAQAVVRLLRSAKVRGQEI